MLVITIFALIRQTFRSHDDISVALSLSSSCDDDKGLNKSFNTPSFTPTTVTIVNKEPPTEYAHPLTMKPMSLSQNHGLHSMFMSCKNLHIIQVVNLRYESK